MPTHEPHIVLRIKTKRPIELGAFVGAFTALNNEYSRFIKRTNPDLVGDADLFVRRITAGSIVADLLPYISMAAPFIDTMDKVVVIEQFVRLWGVRFKALLGVPDSRAAIPETQAELRDWADAVKAIATDPNGSATLQAATYEDGKRKVRASFQFTSQEARLAKEMIELRQNALGQIDRRDFTRVLMRFSRSDISAAALGKPSGERVIIEEISRNALALVYGSELAEEKIKHEIRDADENVYKKGFLVDVNVKYSGDRPVAYSVTNLHQVIDLPDDE